MSANSVVLDLVDRIYCAAESPPSWIRFLERFAEVVRGTVTAMVAGDLRVGQPDSEAGIQLDQWLSRIYSGRSTRETGRAPVGGTGLCAGEVVTDRMLPLARAAGETGNCGALLKSLNVEHLLGGVITRQGNRLSSVSVLRPRRSGEFGDEDVGLLQTLLPHLRRALGLRARWNRERCEHAAVVEALNGVPAGILLLDRAGRPVVVNRAAEEMLAARDGLTLTPEGLVAATCDATRDLRLLIGQAAATNSRSASNRVFAAARPSQRRPYSVLVKPLDAGQPPAGPPTAAVAVFLIDPDRRVRADLGVLGSLYGFTPAECRVAAELVHGESVEEAAEDLDVSMNTARTHMKHLFEKTNTHTHRELVRLLLCSCCCSGGPVTPRNAHHFPIPARDSERATRSV